MISSEWKRIEHEKSKTKPRTSTSKPNKRFESQLFLVTTFTFTLAHTHSNHANGELGRWYFNVQCWQLHVYDKLIIISAYVAVQNKGLLNASYQIRKCYHEWYWSPYACQCSLWLSKMSKLNYRCRQFNHVFDIDKKYKITHVERVHDLTRQRLSSPSELGQSILVRNKRQQRGMHPIWPSTSVQRLARLKNELMHMHCMSFYCVRITLIC